MNCDIKMDNEIVAKMKRAYMESVSDKILDTRVEYKHEQYIVKILTERNIVFEIFCSPNKELRMYLVDNRNDLYYPIATPYSSGYTFENGTLGDQFLESYTRSCCRPSCFWW